MSAELFLNLVISGFDQDGISLAAPLKKDLGGFISFQYNLPGHGKDTTAHKIAHFNKTFDNAKKDGLPPLITVDQEGGWVQRIRLTTYKTPKAVSTMPLDEAEIHYRSLAKELRACGFTWNFGPCVDLNLNEETGVIGKLDRSYGTDPKAVADYAAAFIKAHHKEGLLTCIKHAPGHGSAGRSGTHEADTHKGFVDVTDDFDMTELEPYRILAAKQLVDSIMMAHTFNRTLDPLWPASLSPQTVKMMRDIIGDNPVIVSDDLCMGAMRDKHGFEEAVVQAFKAGNDMIILSHNPAAGKGGENWPETVEEMLHRGVKALETGILTGDIKIRQIETSLRRVKNLRLKLKT